jgi:hypothetical protein
VFSSCATLFNRKTERLTVITEKPGTIRFNGYISDPVTKRIDVNVPRSKNNLTLSVEKQDTTSNYYIKPHSSAVYWLNLDPFTLFLGFLIDMNNPKRYSYPATVYIPKESTAGYLTYVPLDSSTATLKNIIKITPFRLVSLSNSSIELVLERKTSPALSSQIMLSYLLPKNLMDYNRSFKPRNTGYRFSFEEKFYIKNSSPIGPYFAFEINHLNSRYRDNAEFEQISYNREPLSYGDTIIVRKRTTSLNLKFGYQTTAGKLSFDYYCGIGARYRNVIHQDRINPYDDMQVPYLKANFYYLNNLERKNWTFVFLLNFRIGWMF